MADRAHSTPSRRALLAAPAALIAMPSGAVPPAADACLALGLKLGQAVEAYQAGARARLPGAEMNPLWDSVQAASAAVLAAPVHSVGDVAAKLILVLDRVHWASEELEDTEPCDDAAAALRQCLLALPSLTGVRLSALADDFFDIELGKAIAGGRA